MQNQKTILLALVVAILMGGAGFYGGTLYQKSKTPANLGRQMGANFTGRQVDRAGGGTPNAPGGVTGRGGFRPVVGEILSKDDKSITVKMQDGSSKIVMLSSGTAINKADKVDATALVVGETVRVFGTTNTDGSVTAQDIQLNPEQIGQPQGQQSQQPGQTQPAQ